MSNLYEASNQWASRSSDERYWSLSEMLTAVRHYRDSAREAVIPINSLKLQASGTDGADLELIGKAGTPARLTHWSFGQLCRNVSAPADYLRRLPSSLAATNLNHGLLADPRKANLLIHKNGSLVCRSLTSDSYSRIWDADICNRLLSFSQHGWKVPPARPSRGDDPRARPATAADLLEVRDSGLSVKLGDMIAPAGLYASDHDMFVFMVNEQNRIKDGSEGGLSRGFFLSNSEVGAAALKVKTFLYRHCCSNHICWGTSNVQEIKIVHRGNADERFHRELTVELRKYADGSASETEAQIVQAQRFKLGENKEQVLDVLFKHLRGDVSRKVLDASYDQAEMDSNTDRTIDPRTAYGFVQGGTAYSQSLPFADERNRIDQAMGKVLTLAF